MSPPKSGHGGSAASGLVLPMGLEKLQPAVPEGMVLVPQEVVDAREQAKKREERALQLERRRIGLELMPSIIGMSDFTPNVHVSEALAYADALIAATGGGI